MGVGTTLEYANALAVNGSIVASAYNYFSDASLKQDVESVDESACVTLLEAVTPKTYVRNDLNDEGRRIGFIAQDLAANAPPCLQRVGHNDGGQHRASHRRLCKAICDSLGRLSKLEREGGSARSGRIRK